MKTALHNAPAKQSNIALHLMINQLSVSTLPDTIKNENTIINQVPTDLQVHTDAQKLAGVIGSLMSTMISNTKNTVLTISVKEYSNVILLHISGNTDFNQKKITRELTRVQHLAECIGGTVGLTSYHNNNATVALSFINSKAAC